MRSPGVGGLFEPAASGSRSIKAALCALTLCGCASYGGAGLKPGQSTLQDVLATMGEPAARWTAPDHSMQLSYPRGPSGFSHHCADCQGNEGRPGKMSRSRRF